MSFYEFVASDYKRISDFIQKKSLVSVILTRSFISVFLIRLVCNTGTKFVLLKVLGQLVLRLFFSIEISRNCCIGDCLFLPHPKNIILGCGVIGNGVTIMQNVTLGCNYLDPGFNKNCRPIIGNKCFIGVGAVVLGGGALKDGQRLPPNAFVNLYQNDE